MTGSVQDFGEGPLPQGRMDRRYGREDRGTAPAEASSQSGQEAVFGVPTQWVRVAAGTYEGCSRTYSVLPAGIYACGVNRLGEPQLIEQRLEVDDLIDFPSSLPHQIVKEIDGFWGLADDFRDNGYMHRRGYMVYGPAGSGKSAMIAQVIRQMVAKGHLVVQCNHPGMFFACISLLRNLEPQRPVLCTFEDIDALIDEHGDTELLQWLDGASQINKVISIATTNYPEKLDRRIIARPRRFDRIVKVDNPGREIRLQYLNIKFKQLPDHEIEQVVEKTEGFSFAALADLVVSVLCLKNPMEEAIQRLSDLCTGRVSSREFQSEYQMGFSPTKRNHDANWGSGQ